MQIYLSQTDLADLLGRNPQAISYRQANRLLPTPDIYIGNVVTLDPPIPGWAPFRAHMYRDWSARNSGGSSGRLLVSADDIEAEPPIFWHANPEWYLSQREVGQILGLDRESVSHRRIRGTWPVDPVVRIGRNSPGVHGWDNEEVTEYGHQDRYLNAAGKIETGLHRPGPRRKALLTAA